MKKISMCVVPIILRHEQSSFNIVTYALIENCSQASFISKDLLSLLAVPTETTDFIINTITYSKTETCHIVSGLKVKGLH